MLSGFSFQPCVSLESALLERLENFTASETLKIMATEVRRLEQSVVASLLYK